MKLSKAIETVKTELPLYLSNPETDLMQAIKLLLEAGKEIKCLRRDGVLDEEHLLPGETPE